MPCSTCRNPSACTTTCQEFATRTARPLLTEARIAVLWAKRERLPAEGKWPGELDTVIEFARSVLVEASLADRVTPLQLSLEVVSSILKFALVECDRFALALRRGGHEIHKEAQEAYVLRWLLNLYLAHGDDWRTRAGEYLKRCRDGSREFITHT
jgi:hypothetical protein